MVQFYIGVDRIGRCRLPTTLHPTLRLIVCWSAAGTILPAGLAVVSASARSPKKIITSITDVRFPRVGVPVSSRRAETPEFTGLSAGFTLRLGAPVFQRQSMCHSYPQQT